MIATRKDCPFRKKRLPFSQKANPFSLVGRLGPAEDSVVAQATVLARRRGAGRRHDWQRPDILVAVAKALSEHIERLGVGKRLLVARHGKVLRAQLLGCRQVCFDKRQSKI